MSKKSAIAYSNIALVKYWGKKESGLRLPMNSSVAIGLDSIHTTTTVDFDDKYLEDIVEIDGDVFNAEEKERVSAHLDLVRAMANTSSRARVVTKNNFPKAVGAASSASGFAALTMAAAHAAGLTLSSRELSMLARQGSGSAARSIPGGFSVWHTGETNEESYAEPLSFPENWDLRVLLVFVGEMKQKKVGSTEGMEWSKKTSPYYELAVKEAFNNERRLKKALRTADWRDFGKVIEDECYRLHMLCMTTTPNILYWSAETLAIFQKLLALREQHIDGFFTVDAGPHVHVVCLSKDAERIKKEMNAIYGVKAIVDCGVGGPAQLVEEHLF